MSTVPSAKLKIVKSKAIKPDINHLEIQGEDDEKEKLREMNRAAQLRCRKRKRIKLERMEEDLKEIKAENVKMKEENYCLKHKVSLLREFILDERKKANNEHNLWCNYFF